MHVIRKQAQQAGYVPDHSYVSGEIFDPEIFHTEPIVYPDSAPPTSTPAVVYECRDCLAQLFEDELDGHICDEDPLGDYGESMN